MFQEPYGYLLFNPTVYIVMRFDWNWCVQFSLSLNEAEWNMPSNKRQTRIPTALREALFIHKQIFSCYGFWRSRGGTRLEGTRVLYNWKNAHFCWQQQIWCIDHGTRHPTMFLSCLSWSRYRWTTTTSLKESEKGRQRETGRKAEARKEVRRARNRWREKRKESILYAWEGKKS